VWWKITLEPVSFYSVVIEYEHRRRPHGVETMEVSRVFFDVCFEWNKSLVDEFRDLIVGV